MKDNPSSEGGGSVLGGWHPASDVWASAFPSTHLPPSVSPVRKAWRMSPLFSPLAAEGTASLCLSSQTNKHVTGDFRLYRRTEELLTPSSLSCLRPGQNPCPRPTVRGLTREWAHTVTHLQTPLLSGFSIPPILEDAGPRSGSISCAVWPSGSIPAEPQFISSQQQIQSPVSTNYEEEKEEWIRLLLKKKKLMHRSCWTQDLGMFISLVR